MMSNQDEQSESESESDPLEDWEIVEGQDTASMTHLEQQNTVLGK